MSRATNSLARAGRARPTGGLEPAAGATIIGAIAAWTAPETYRIPLNELGTPDAKPVSREEYDRLRTEARAAKP
ncbi:hypothetical protein [Arthrobacter sp.]|uniref:hypothetical protein n=1 Tax=Arthrobacter sp. TaxID=1667 RepID=UPI0028111FA1|nr:hypothetical protein [Arthrobacter sp.]